MYCEHLSAVLLFRSFQTRQPKSKTKKKATTNTNPEPKTKQNTQHAEAPPTPTKDALSNSRLLFGSAEFTNISKQITKPSWNIYMAVPILCRFASWGPELRYFLMDNLIFEVLLIQFFEFVELFEFQVSKCIVVSKFRKFLIWEMQYWGKSEMGLAKFGF